MAVSLSVIKRLVASRVAVRLLHSVDRMLSIPARSGIFNRAILLLKRQSYVDINPEQLFGDRLAHSGTVDRLFFVVRHELPEIIMQPIDPHEVAHHNGFFTPIRATRVHVLVSQVPVCLSRRCQ